MKEDNPNQDAPVALSTYLDLLGRYLKPQWRKAALMAALLLAGIALQLLVPQILRYFIDTATGGGATELLVRAAILYLVAAFANQILGRGRDVLRGGCRLDGDQLHAARLSRALFEARHGFFIQLATRAR